MQPRLLANSGSLAGTVRPLIDGQISIGLDESSQPSLVDAAVPRMQCTIQQVGKQFEVLDSDRSNGTFVNGNLVDQLDLHIGDIIEIGGVQMQLLKLNEI